MGSHPVLGSIKGPKADGAAGHMKPGRVWGCSWGVGGACLGLGCERGRRREQPELPKGRGS